MSIVADARRSEYDVYGVLRPRLNSNAADAAGKPIGLGIHLYVVMNRVFISFALVVLGVLSFSSTVSAQRNIDQAIDRDPVLEQDAKHNLEVAKQAYLLKKAYKGVLMRFEETFAAYPEFSKMDEFLYLAG